MLIEYCEIDCLELWRLLGCNERGNDKMIYMDEITLIHHGEFCSRHAQIPHEHVVNCKTTTQLLIWLEGDVMISLNFMTRHNR